MSRTNKNKAFKKSTLPYIPHWMLWLCTLFGCNKNTKIKKFEWEASESSPQNYPMEIVSGSFILKDGSSLYIPNGKTIHDGWGNSISTHVVGDVLKSLPTQIDIVFFSYTENQFYQASFNLPYDLILKYFKNGYYSLKEQSQTTYNGIVAGIAPNGSVSIWIKGLDRSIQVFYGKAQEADIPWTSIIDNPDYTREKFIREELDESLSADELLFLKENGVPTDLWDRYQNQYHWQPRLLTENRPPKLINKIQYVNGEKDYLFYPLESPIAEKTRAIPNYFYYSWKDPSGKALAHHFDFNEQEIVAAFEKLHAIKTATVDSPIYLNVTVAEHIEGRRIMITVQHEDEVITLLKTKIKQYASGYPADNPDAFYQD